MAALAICKDLRVLRFNNSPKLTDKCLEHIGNRDQLGNLSLSRTAITDKGLEHLKGLKKLYWLSLDNTSLTGTGFVHLKEMGALRRLDLGYTNVTDDTLAGLSGLASLELVNLGPLVTDAGLLALYGLKNLQSIDGIKVTPTGYNKLMQEVKKAREKP